MKTKKLPERMCIGCGSMKLKKELVRIVKDKDGNISIDATGKKAGRGAYICKDMNCLKKVQKKKGLEHSFSMKIDDAIYTSLESELNGIE